MMQRLLLSCLCFSFYLSSSLLYCSKKKYKHINTKTSKTASHPGSSHPSPRGQCYRNSRPVAPTSLHPHRSTIWVCPSPPRSPHTHPSLPPERTSPYAALCQEKPPGSLLSLGSVCRTPYVKEREVKGSASLEKGI